jgi:hypothetical protein
VTVLAFVGGFAIGAYTVLLIFLRMHNNSLPPKDRHETPHRIRIARLADRLLKPAIRLVGFLRNRRPRSRTEAGEG